MKKNVCFSIIVSAIISVLGLIINVISASLFHFAPLTISFSGGDVIEHIGFGIDFLEISPLSLNSEVITKIELDFLNLIQSFILLFIIILIIKIIFYKIKKK